MTTQKQDQPRLTNEETIKLLYNLIDIESNEEVKYQLRNTLQKLELKKAIHEDDEAQSVHKVHKIKM